MNTPIEKVIRRLQKSGRLRRLYQDAGQFFAPPAGPKPPADLKSRRQAAKRVHVGCGPKNIFPGWYNVDLRWFPGVDEALDVTKSWPFDGLERIYAEHFLEHLPLWDAVHFLERAGQSLVQGGKIRLSTPNLHWVWLTHFHAAGANDEVIVADTLKSNRAFHGWGHQFLWSEAMLRLVLEGQGYTELAFCGYGESLDPSLRDLERHGGYSIEGGQPSVVIVEATRGARPIATPASLAARLEDEFGRFVRSGH